MDKKIFGADLIVIGIGDSWNSERNKLAHRGSLEEKQSPGEYKHLIHH